MKSIKLRMVIVFTSLVLVISVGLGAVSVTMLSEHLQQANYQSLESLAEAEAKHLRSVLEQEFDYLSNLARNPMVLEDLTRTMFLFDEAKIAGYKSLTVLDQDAAQDDEFFRQALGGKNVVSDVRINPKTDQPEIIFAVPWERKGELGVLYGVHDPAFLSEIVNQTKYRQSGYAYVNNIRGTNQAHGDYNRVLTQDNVIENAKHDPELGELAALMENQILSGETGYAGYNYLGVKRLVGYAPIEGTEWVLITAVEAAEVDQEVASSRNILLGIVVAFTLAGIVVTVFLSNSIVKPIRSLIPLMEKFGSLNFSFDSSIEASRYLKRKDETGQVIRTIANVEKVLSEIISQIQEIADNVAQTSANLSAAAQENSATIEEVASATGAFSQNVDEANKKAEVMGTHAAAIDQLAGEGGQQMATTMNAMKGIEAGSIEVQTALQELSAQTQNMTAVLNLIADIADQTNLLALNAAIEAARAGEHGRGFAVVADEVRNLAEQTQRSIVEITQMINGLVTTANHSADTMTNTKQEIEDGTKLLVQTQQDLVAITEKVAVTTQMVKEMGHSVQEMQATSGGIAASTEEQAATMEQIAGTAGNLAHTSEILRATIARFKI